MQRLVGIALLALLGVASGIRLVDHAPTVPAPKADKKESGTLDQQIASKNNEVAELEKKVAAMSAKDDGIDMDAEVAKDTKPVTKPVAKPVAKSVKPEKPRKPLTEAEQLAKMQVGLKAIEGLRSMFTAPKEPQVASSKFANGALSDELSKPDSQVWGALSTMIASTEKAMAQMKNKTKAEQHKLMESLESDMDGKASLLNNITTSVDKVQQNENEEYVLGLLNMHREWNMEKQLNATGKLMKGSPLLEELYKHHDASKPLAPQLAALMDGKPRGAGAAAAKLLIQLASSLHDSRE